ncbi:hypothetical protein [Paraburkholderia bryophila]|uniref:Uncharacterized protein n=1 Tax=Paraburkholderia bryophila TaxID=420952 RepID=A0A329D315_9BURK|nr:hypothetical protein [Paraburkholderia bryophila]RAS38684.1 hypothetical protein BX591_10113 [Paraburkholderia bryophila]
MEMHKRVWGGVAIAVCVLSLSACGTTQMNMIDVQSSTAKTLGLASSDEITVSNIQYGKKNVSGQRTRLDGLS